MARGGVHHSAPARHAAPAATHAAAVKHASSPTHAPVRPTTKASLARPATRPAPRPAGVHASGVAHPGSGFASAALNAVSSLGASSVGGGMVQLPTGEVVPHAHARAMGYMGKRRTKKFSVTSRDLKSLTKIAKLVSLVSKVTHTHRKMHLTHKRKSSY